MDESPWDTVLRGDAGFGQSWQLFKDIFLRAQELSVPICGKSGREGRKQAWLNEDLLLKFRQKELHRWWKQGRVPWEEGRNDGQGWGQESQGTKQSPSCCKQGAGPGPPDTTAQLQVHGARCHPCLPGA